MAAKLGQSKKPARRAAAAPPSDHNPRSEIGNNREAVEAAEAAQLLSFTSRLREQQKKTAEKKAVFDGEKANETEIFNLAKAAGFMRKELQELLDDSAVSGQRRKLAESEARRARFRKILGLPVAGFEEQKDLPEEVRDEMDWESDGYRAGIRADEPKPPSECSPRFHKAWLKGYHNGQKRNAEALTMADALGAPPPPVPEPEVEKSAADIRRDEKAEERRAREMLDAIAEVEPEIVAQVEEDHGADDSPPAVNVAPGYSVTGPSEETGLYTTTAPNGLVIGEHFTSEHAAWSAAGYHCDTSSTTEEAV